MQLGMLINIHATILVYTQVMQYGYASHIEL